MILCGGPCQQGRATYLARRPWAVVIFCREMSPLRRCGERPLKGRRMRGRCVGTSGALFLVCIQSSNAM